MLLLFFDGAIMMGFLTAGLFFLRFWRRSRDRLFLMFCVSFWILAINRAFLAWLSHASTLPNEHQALLYTIRLIAFVLILIAIIDKNRSARTPLAR